MGRWTGEATEWQMRSIGEGENSSRLDGYRIISMPTMTVVSAWAFVPLHV